MADLKLQVIMQLADRAAAPLRNITRGSKEAAQALKAARETVKSLNDQQRKVDGFTRQQAAMQAASDKAKVLRQNVAALTQAHGANSTQVKTAEKALAKATTEFNKQRDAAVKLRGELNKAGIGNVAQAQARISRETAAATAQIERQTNRLKAAGGMQRLGLGDNLQRIGAQVSSLRNQAAVGLAATGYFFKRFFLDVAADFEDFQTVLETTEGSSAGAQRAMKWVSDFATRTPYELAEVTEAYVKLRAYGLDPTNGLLKSLGDTAAAMKKPVLQAVEAIADAVTGENERLKEFGIKAAKQGGSITYAYTDQAGNQKSATVDGNNRKLIESTLTAIFNEKYSGAMDKLSRTWRGMLSNLSDQWARFTNTAMNAGLFDYMKNKLSGLLATLDRMAENGQLQAWAEKTGAALKAVAENTWAFFQGIQAVLTRLAEFVGGWKNLGIILVALKLLPLLLLLGQLGMALAVGAKFALLFATGTASVGAALGVVGTALATVGRLMFLNPIGLTLTAIAVAALLIYKYWGPITAFFTRVWTSITTGLSSLWQSFKTMGGQLIDGLVGGITSRMSAVRDAIGNVASSTIGWFREKLGIRSPSRVFMVAGHHLGEGAALGINRSARLVQRASAGLTAAAMVPSMAMAGARIDARPPLAAGSTSAPTVVQGDTITIQVSAAPGQDPQSLARAIAAELDRRAAAKQARSRGALTDLN